MNFDEMKSFLRFWLVFVSEIRSFAIEMGTTFPFRSRDVPFKRTPDRETHNLAFDACNYSFFCTFVQSSAPHVVLLFGHTAPKGDVRGAKHDRRWIFFRLETPIFPLCGFLADGTRRHPFRFIAKAVAGGHNLT